MSTEYVIAEGAGIALLVTTHGGKLDLDVADQRDYATITSSTPKELAEIGFRLIRAAMFNDYSGPGCTVDVDAFKQWVHTQVDAL